MKLPLSAFALLGLAAACQSTTTTDMQRAEAACMNDEANETCVSETYAGLRQDRADKRAKLDRSRRDTGKPEGGSVTMRKASEKDGNFE